MRALRVVGLTEDSEVVLEDPVRLERFRVPADERLRAAARGDLSRLGQIAIELESQLRPREIQARIRAGASVEQVAAAAGVPEQKIERFAYPVLLERFRTAEVGQRAHPMRADGPDNRTLAEVVAHTFGLRGQAYEGARWDSWKGEDGRWVVALSWRAGRSDNRAHWTFQPGAHGGTVTALDEHASDLVEGLPARPLRTVGAVVDMNRPEEEPPPAPSPVEQWRAAASDSYRDPGRPAAERNPARGTPAEPWRPAPPVQRQSEPATGAYKGADGRPPAEPRDGGSRVAPEWGPGDHGPAPQRIAPPARSESARAEAARTEQRADPALRESDGARVEVRSGARGADAGELSRPLDGTPAPRVAGTVAGPAPGAPRAADTAVPAAPARVGEAGAVTPRVPVEAGGAAASPAEIAARIAGAAAAPAAGLPAPTDTAPPAAQAPTRTDNTAPPAAQAPARTDNTAPPAAQAPTGADNTAPPEAEAPARTDNTAPPAPQAPIRADATAASMSEAPPSAGLAGPARAPQTGRSASATPASTVAAPFTETPPTPEPAAPAGDRLDPPPAAPPADIPPSESDARGAAPEPAPPAGRRTRKGKPVMPSWDEVLLGVRGPR